MISGMTDHPPVGLKIKRARERLRWTQEQLGAAVGVSQKTIDNWENDRRYPRSSIGALEEVLNIDLGVAAELRESLREQVVRLEALARRLRAQLDEEEGNGHDETPRWRREA